jgi:hypothetical protein
MTVTALEDARRRRPKPAEAAELARGAGVRLTERRALELLIRLSNGSPIARRRGWLADELGVTVKTVQRVIGSLERAGLVVVVRRGIGHTSSAYLVNFARLTAGVQPDDVAVQPSESTSGERGQNVPPEGSECPPGGSKTSPQRVENVHTQRAGARDARALPSHLIPLTPDHDSAGLTDQGPSPIASDGAPFLEKCEHGRTARQPCRRCGTDSRTAERAARKRQAEDDRVAALERARERREVRGTVRPANFRELVAAAKSATPTTEGASE